MHGGTRPRLSVPPLPRLSSGRSENSASKSGNRRHLPSCHLPHGSWCPLGRTSCSGQPRWGTVRPAALARSLPNKQPPRGVTAAALIARSVSRGAQAQPASGVLWDPRLGVGRVVVRVEGGTRATKPGSTAPGRGHFISAVCPEPRVRDRAVTAPRKGGRGRKNLMSWDCVPAPWLCPMLMSGAWEEEAAAPPCPRPGLASGALAF